MDEPSVSRVYDAYLGGAANNRADRTFASRIQEVVPDVQELAVANRRFLARGVSYAVSQGVDQIIDLGAGVPSIWQTHLVAHGLNPEARVVYVDHEAVAYEALRAACADDARLAAVRADLRDAHAVLNAENTRKLIDFTKPVILVLGLLLHFVSDDEDPAGLLASYRAGIASGSYLVISHDTADGRETAMRQLAALYAEVGRPVVLRDHAQMTALLAGFDLVEPGIVHMPLWHPHADDPVSDDPTQSCVYAAVART